jgi:hypothetical protein
MLDFLKKPLAAARREDPPACTVEEREALLAEIAAEEAAWAETDGQLDRQVRDARERVTQTEVRLRDERTRLDQLESDRLTRSLSHERRVGQLRLRLQRGASAAVERFLAELASLEDQVRGGFQARERLGFQNLAGRRPIVIETNNAAEVVTAIRAVRAEAEALRFLAIDEDDVVKRLRALAETIPQVTGVPVDVPTALGLSPGELREAEWNAERPRETSQPWR